MEPFEGGDPYCPRCRREYLPGITRICPDCGVELVHERAPETPAEGAPDLEALQSWVGTDPIAILETFDHLRADLVRSVLIDAAIPCSVWSSGYHTGALPIRVMIHKDDVAEAGELLAALFSEGEPGPDVSTPAP